MIHKWLENGWITLPCFFMLTYLLNVFIIYNILKRCKEMHKHIMSYTGKKEGTSRSSRWFEIAMFSYFWIASHLLRYFMYFLLYIFFFLERVSREKYHQRNKLRKIVTRYQECHTVVKLVAEARLFGNWKEWHN